MKKVRYLSILASFLLLSACSDDEPKFHPQIVEDLPDNTTDIVNGKLVHYIDVDDLEACRLPLNILKKVTFTFPDDSPLEFEAMNIDGKLYAVPRMKEPFAEPYRLVRVNVKAVTDTTKQRNILLVLSHGGNEDKQSRAGELISHYSQYLGKGTAVFDEIGNIKRSVLLYDKLPENEDVFTYSTTSPKTNCIEFEGNDYEKTMTEWGFNVGITAKLSHKEWQGPQYYGGFNGTEKLPRSQHRPFTVTGSANFGMTGSEMQSASYEYYMSLITVNCANAKLNMGYYDGYDSLDPNPEIWNVVSSNFVDAIFQSNPIDTDKFFDQWGTHVITTGIFGGYAIYMYGRKENCYEKSVGYDANASVKVSHSGQGDTDDAWADIYRQVNMGEYVGVDFDMSYRDENYWESSKALTMMKFVGGTASTDFSKWLDGFSDSKKWALISYSPSKLTKDEETNLYSIDRIACCLLHTYYNLVYEPCDSTVFKKAENNIKAIQAADSLYINSHYKEMGPKERLVLADVMMKKGANNHKKGDPKPFVAENPRYSAGDKARYLTYYPMMANRHAPADHGYAMETSQNKYLHFPDDADHYWYYALAPEGDVTGIVDIECDDDDDGEYHPRGDHPDEGGISITKNRICVKYYDEKKNKPNQKITAFGLYLKEKHPKDGHFNVDAVCASTGGAELQTNYTGSEVDSWKEFWKSGEINVSQWNEGALSVPNPLWPCFSRKNLRLKRVSNNNVQHPKKWGE